MLLKFNKMILNNVLFRSINIYAFSNSFMLGFGWAIQKGDWWKSRYENKAKFISFEFMAKSEKYTRSGIYVGRLALVFQTSNCREGEFK